MNAKNTTERAWEKQGSFENKNCKETPFNNEKEIAEIFVIHHKDFYFRKYIRLILWPIPSVMFLSWGIIRTFRSYNIIYLHHGDPTDTDWISTCVSSISYFHNIMLPNTL